VVNGDYIYFRKSEENKNYMKQKEMNTLQIYAPQTGCSSEGKEEFKES
jgi:hypothetical protein